MLPSVEFQEIKCMHSFMNVLSLLLSIKFCYNLKDYEYGIYSTDRPQPNTKAHRESGLGVSCGSASSPLSKKLRLLWIRSESALGGSLCALMREADPHSVVTTYKPTSPRPLYIPKYTVQLVHYVVAIGSIHTCRTVKLGFF